VPFSPFVLRERIHVEKAKTPKYCSHWCPFLLDYVFAQSVGLYLQGFGFNFWTDSFLYVSGNLFIYS